MFYGIREKNAGIGISVKKTRKAWFSIQKTWHKSSEKTMEVHLKLIDSLFFVTSNILYTCECVGRFFIDCFPNKIEKKKYVSSYKQILQVTKKKKVIKTFAEIRRTLLKINIEIKNL